MDVRVAQFQPNMESRYDPSKDKKDIYTNSRGKTKTSTFCNSDIKYFHYLRVGHIASRYPNKRIIIMMAYSKVLTDSEGSDEKEMP
jgi:hypothetical protein